MKPLLVLDVGNTSIGVGLFRGRRLERRARVPTHGHPSSGDLTAQIAAALGGCNGVAAAVIASVVPPLDRPLQAAVRRRWGCRPVCVGPRSPLGLKLKVREPLGVGADRLVNALGAWRMTGGAAVVVDMGTAMTFDCVSAAGEFLGGAILPGPRLAAEALAEKTAKLPLIMPARPLRVIGRSTRECLQAGLYHGTVGMIRHVLELTLRELRPARPALLWTGGYARLFRRDLPPGGRWEPDLTLRGLRFAYDCVSGEGTS